MTEPASIRYKNPGAMWPGTRATKWGSTSYVTLNDGQRNKIAIFPTFVQGAAAQFDLWSSNYTDMTLKAAINKWSGHNSPASYVAYLEKNTGVSISAMVTRNLLASAAGWKLLKAQSNWEAGKPIPMTDADWQQAQTMFFENAKPPIAEMPFLNVGDTGDDVKTMQNLLNKNGTALVVDGVFGAKQTLPALMAFQRHTELRDDGICGPLTWEKLRANVSVA
jgi:hypothetical protein